MTPSLRDMHYSRALAAAALGLALALTGCSSDDAGGSSTGKGFDEADVAFASDMIQHHAQALQMVDLTMDRDLAPEVQALAEDIRDAQAPEIEMMAGWLKDWDEPVPATARDHVNAHGDMDMGSDMPGMMSSDDMQSLEAATDADFESMWLAMMVEHHQGAIEMAEEEQADGEHPKSVSLAKDIAEAQAEEVSTMQRFQDR